MAPFAPRFGPATFSPIHAPASLPSIRLLLLPRPFGIRRSGGGECSQPDLGDSCQLLVGKIPQSIFLYAVFGSFAGLARVLIRNGHGSPDKPNGPKKGDEKMSSQFKRTLVAVVGPAQANAAPVKVSVNA